MRLRLPSTAQVLLAAVLIIQIPLWFGQGGWLHVWRLERQLDQQLQKAEQQKQVIQELEAELKDLKSGVTAAEERARYEMGMMKPNERFVQIVTPSASPANPAESPGQTPPASTR
ncbi:MAG: cell division protein FtsB [Burkholderiaceae bacterium]|jgi:cell division protein FtsB